MPNKIFNTRIRNKRDTAANWETVASTFQPLDGEVIIVYTADGATRFKVGRYDSVKGRLLYYNELPFTDESLGNKIYTQNEEPVDAADGALWVDLDEISSSPSIIPIPTVSDEGKYLGCESGAAKWMSVAASGIDIPTTLPNPKSLTFTGAVNASYDGSSEVSVEIPDISGKMDKNNPTGTGAFSLNRKAGTVIGDYSHAEGFGTTASGESSHAEGFGTTASGWDSHTEGCGTKASSSNQHVQGKYNIKDSSGVYADIIGNGNSSKPSNAATVDWSGNAWYAGDVYVGSTSGTNKDEGSKKLATEEYVDNSVIVPAPSSTDEEKVLRVVGGKATWVSLPSASEVSF